jgi:hypothetical protein
MADALMIGILSAACAFVALYVRACTQISDS